MPNILRLDILRTLREEAGITQEKAARLCGLQGKQSRLTFSQWEMGSIIPRAQRRGMLLTYLWDQLHLRKEPEHFLQVWEVLVEEWDWEPLSDREWKELTNQARPVAAASNLTASPAPTLAPFQAPALPPHFVGRTAAIAQVATWLTAPASQPIVALVGMGGVGKTTLATHAAHTLRTHFADGVLWAHAGVSTPLDILQSWARAFGYDYSGLRDVESCAATLRSTLAEKQLLLILDNVDSAQAVRPLFLGGKHCAFLLTTRSEDVAVALGSQVLPLTELAPTEGVQLLTNLLGQARVDSEPADAATICQLVHHLPLAVEIVGQLLAARGRRPLAQMAQRLQDVQYRLDLQISDRDVRTSFLVSWEALDGVHRRVFTQLALFGGRSFTAAALAAILEDEVEAVAEQLDTLVARSLVSAVEGDRYRQHPLLADFAREQLGDAPAPWQRFATSQLEFARRHQQAFAALEPEWDNLMAGMETAHRLQQWQLVLDYADTLTEPWLTRARYTQARQGYAWAVEAAEMMQEQETEVRLLCNWGNVCIEQSDHSDASAILDRGLRLAYQLEVDDSIANTQFAQARICIERADYPRAEQLLTNCKAVRGIIGDVVGSAAVTYWQGFIAYRHGQYAVAGKHCLDASHVQKQAKDQLGLLRTLRLQTDIAFKCEDFDNALHYGQQALSLAQTLQDHGEYAAALYNLSKVYRRTGKLAQAEKSAEASRVLFQQMGSKLFYAFTLFELSRIRQAQGELKVAIDYAQQSIGQLRLLQDKFSLVTVLRILGDQQTQMDALDSARATWTEALAMAREQDHPDIHALQERLQTSSTNGVAFGLIR